MINGSSSCLAASPPWTNSGQILWSALRLAGSAASCLIFPTQFYIIFSPFSKSWHPALSQIFRLFSSLVLARASRSIPWLLRMQRSGAPMLDTASSSPTPQNTLQSTLTYGAITSIPLSVSAPCQCQCSDNTDVVQHGHYCPLHT